MNLEKFSKDMTSLASNTSPAPSRFRLTIELDFVASQIISATISSLTSSPRADKNRFTSFVPSLPPPVAASIPYTSLNWPSSSADASLSSVMAETVDTNQKRLAFQCGSGRKGCGLRNLLERWNANSCFTIFIICFTAHLKLCENDPFYAIPTTTTDRTA
mmetsp:Transcript_35636/g.92894  ORF Transcript_35636/g.92894 Transcript_35636/m.92894 type:complete len:160 (+) Transcript_35636:513-992(+)